MRLILRASIGIGLVVILLGFLPGQPAAQPTSDQAAVASAPPPSKVAPDGMTLEFAEATHENVDFFGVKASFPRPPQEAKIRLLAFIEKYPANSEARRHLASLAQELQDFALAEAQMQAIVTIDKASPPSLRGLATFYHQRANFAQEAATLQRLLISVPQRDKGLVFYELLELAERHQLDQYFDEAADGSFIKEDPAGFALLQKLIDNLIAKNRLDHAMKLLQKYQPDFKSKRSYFITSAANILIAQHDPAGAEAIYSASFDPFWPTELSDNFYNFLRDSDRYQEYRHRLQEDFYRQPADFKAAMQLFHLLMNENETESARTVLRQLEQARTKRAGEGEWSTTELATVGQLLLTLRENNDAARYFYTLHLQGGLPQGSEERDIILYRLFRSLIDADTEATVFRSADITFYRDIAKSDQQPGLLGGILSLILANSGPINEYEKSRERANRYYNRSAAYRVLTAYQQEYPKSAVLPQMYLDLAEVYARMDQSKLVDEIVAEYQHRFPDAPNYADIGLGLADLYIRMKQRDKADRLYQQLLDAIGQQHHGDGPLLPPTSLTRSESFSRITNPRLSYLQQPSSTFFLEAGEANYEPDPGQDDSGNTNENQESSDEDTPAWQDDLVDQEQAQAAESENDIYRDEVNREVKALPEIKLKGEATYATVLQRYIHSLAVQNQPEKILALYWQELRKYPHEEGLYEHFLQWLRPSNLINAQLQAYQMAIANINRNKSWQARLARWYIRHERRREFGQISERLMNILDAAETREYLEEFIRLKDDDTDIKANDYDAELYLRLYQLAQRRFPTNPLFVSGLLHYYQKFKMNSEYLNLALQYYFSGQREPALQELARTNRLQAWYQQASRLASEAEKQPPLAGPNLAALAYRQFSADAAIWFSEYENAVAAYRQLVRSYPGHEEYANRLASLLRSFGQQNEANIAEAIELKKTLANIYPLNEAYRTEAGELYALLGDFAKAREEWAKLPALRRGDSGVYLDTASIFWDYYQYDDALGTIEQLRALRHDDRIYAFQAGVIYENKHDLGRAVAEYVKDLAIYERQLRAIYRLKQLSDRPGGRGLIAQAVEQRLTIEGENKELVIGYARLFDRIGDTNAAAAIFQRAIPISRDIDFLHIARGFFGRKGRRADEELALTRMAVVAGRGLPAISYRRQLAALYENAQQPERSRSIFDQLCHDYPNNYGVIITSMKFYWRHGYNERLFTLLQDASQRGRGPYHFEFGIRLANYQALANDLKSAKETLAKLYHENPRSQDLLERYLAILGRAKQEPELLAVYREARQQIIALNDRDRFGRSERLEWLHQTMITMLAKIGDAPAVLAQHIELINIAPIESDYVAQAFEYARQHDFINNLIDYYRQLAESAHKNYRWAVVLARIYELQNNWPAAASEYQQAIRNEPQLVELYQWLAETYIQQHHPAEAISQLELAAKLTGDGDIQKKAATLKKIHFDDRPLARNFIANLKIQASSDAEIAQTREIFKNLPSKLYQYDEWELGYRIEPYAKILRQEQDILGVFNELWRVRELLERESFKPDNSGHDQALALLAAFDSHLPEALEKSILHGNDRAVLKPRLQSLVPVNMAQAADQQRVEMLLQLARACDLKELAEALLRQRLDYCFDHRDARVQDQNGQEIDRYHFQLASMSDFYSERGLFRSAYDLLQREYKRDPQRSKFDYWRKMAILARYDGDGVAELGALSQLYREQSGAMTTNRDELFERYFGLLLANGQAGRQELSELIARPHPNWFQLIHFLIKQNERDLAYQAIAASELPELWRLSRRAEAALILADYSPESARAFQQALGPQTIGATLKHTPDPQRDLLGDDWFLLATDFGRWLGQAAKQLPPNNAGTAANTEQERMRTIRAYLLGLIENRPNDPKAQQFIGQFYLSAQQYRPALVHLELAFKQAHSDWEIELDLATAYWQNKQPELARRHWQALLASQAPVEMFSRYYQSLTTLGLTAEARATLRPVMARHLASLKHRAELEADFEGLKPLLRQIVQSFPQPNEIKDYFFQFPAGPAARLIYELLLNERLIPPQDHISVLHRLIPLLKVPPIDFDINYHNKITALGGDPQSYAYEDDGDNDPAWNANDSVNENGPGDDDGTWLGRRRQLIELLLASSQTPAALQEINELEQAYRGRLARPTWLRMAHNRADLRLGNSTAALANLASYCGLQSRPGQVRLPNISHCHQVEQLLRGEKHDEDAREMLGNAYRRALALSQFTLANFIGYAQYQFDRNERNAALQTLQAMITAAQPGRSTSELHQLAESFQTAAEAREFRDMAANNQLSPPPLGIYQYEWEDSADFEAYRLDLEACLIAAAETALKYQARHEALNYEQELLALSDLTPAFYDHRLYFARLLAQHGEPLAAVRIIAEALARPQISENQRLTGLISLTLLGHPPAEILAETEKNQDITAETRAGIRLLAAKDPADWQKVAGTRNELASYSDHPLFALFRGLAAARLGDFERARTSLAQAIPLAAPDQYYRYSEEEVSPLLILFDSPRWQLIRLYAQQGGYLAALQLAAQDSDLKAVIEATSTNEAESLSAAATRKDNVVATLAQIKAKRLHESQKTMLELLSDAAERSGEFEQAIQFENALSQNFSTEANRLTRQERLASLNRQLQADAAKSNDITIDSRLLRRR